MPSGNLFRLLWATVGGGAGLYCLGQIMLAGTFGSGWGGSGAGREVLTLRHRRITADFVFFFFDWREASKEIAAAGNS